MKKPRTQRHEVFPITTYSHSFAATPGTPDECWEWQGCRNEKGYGAIKHRGTQVYAHRYAYTLFCGPIPEDMKVLHRCDNPPCWNPAHLFLGTQADNVQDMIEKGRAFFQKTTSDCKGTGNAK